MKTGNRNRRIVIEYEARTGTDDYGAETNEWLVLCEAWAEVRFGTGQERREAAQDQGSEVATFQVLANAKTKTIGVLDRIKFDGSIWNITSAVPSREFNAGIDLTAARIVPKEE